MPGTRRARRQGVANIGILERENLIPRGPGARGSSSTTHCDPLADHEAAGELRAGTGLLAAIDLDKELLARDPGAVGRLTMGARPRRRDRPPARIGRRGLAAADRASRSTSS